MSGDASPEEVVDELDTIESALRSGYEELVDIRRSTVFTAGEEGSLDSTADFTGPGRWGQRLNGELQESHAVGIQMDLAWKGTVPKNALHYTKVLYVAEQGEDGLRTAAMVRAQTGYAGSGRYLDREDEDRAEAEVSELLQEQGVEISDELEREYGRFWKD